MDTSGRIARQTLLFSLLVLIVSMLIFPKRYGTELVETPLVYVVYELAFYGVAVYLLNRFLSPGQLLFSVGLCLVYRFAMGISLGLLIVVMYEWQIKIAVLAGMGRYLPALLLHVAATPFILRSVIRSMYFVPTPKRIVVGDSSAESTEMSGPTSISVSKEKGFTGTTPQSIPRSRQPESKDSQTGTAASAPAEADGFERACRYIGEDGSVLMVAVVDTEGLLLGNFSRRGVEAEDWAPFALSLRDNNLDVSTRMGCQDIEKVDMLFADKKVAIACEKSYHLMVVAERATDDVLNIRINQGLEMIRKYVAERYSEKLIGNSERTYV